MSNNITINQKEKELILILNIEDEEVNLAKVGKDGVEKEGFLIKKKKVKKLIKPSHMKIVGLSLAAVALISTLVYLLNLPPWEERVYNRYYRTYEKDSFSLYDATDFNQVKKRYHEGDSEDAWYIIKNLNENYSVRNEILFFKALITMDRGYYKEAIELFEALLENSSDNSYMAKTKWYQGLCYLKIRDIDKATETFGAIPSLFPEENKKAQKILKRINKHKV